MTANPLRGIVVERFGSAGKFATALNWSGRKTRDIVSGRQTPTAKDIEHMASVLGVNNPKDFMRIFFNELSPQSRQQTSTRETLNL